MKRLLKFFSIFSLLLSALMYSGIARAQEVERVYATGELQLTPQVGGETQYFAVNLENAAQSYVAYQMDIVLPPGLELATYEGEPDIYIDNKKIGTSPYIQNNILVGEHQIEIKKKGYKTEK